MSEVTLETLLSDFEKAKKILLASRRRETHSRISYYHLDEKMRAHSPDGWLSDEKIIAPYMPYKSDCPPLLEAFFNETFTLYDASVEAAQRYIVARDFNEFREGKWQVLAKLINA